MNKIENNFIAENYKNKNALMIKFSVIFTVLLIPVVTYLVILNINPSLKYYLDNYEGIKDAFGVNVLASTFEITFLSWMSLSLFVIGFSMIVFLKPFLNSKLNNNYKLSYIITIAAFAVFAVVIEAISEYGYSRFYNLFEFLVQEEISSNFSGSLESMKEHFKEMYSNGFKYKWSTDTLTWWFAIFKIIAVILCFNIWLKNDNNKKIIIEQPSRSLSQSKIKDFINKFSLNSRKNILFWLIVGTTLVFITPLVFIINMCLINSQMNSLLNWTFIISDLYKTLENGDVSNITKGSYFAIKFLPVIVSGFLIANILISSVAYIQNWRTSNKTFAFEFSVLLIEILCVLIVIAYSAHESQRLTDMWNSGKISFSSEILESKYLIKTYGSLKWQSDTVTEPWMSGLKYISQTIISLSFLATIYVILGVKFKKINENN
ncbi:hypothetical protein [Spiroplasma monobiae]|uniref:Transmembrane protein n=1 Tax=Spiroplasma monobiae MQ-1 TaxID=1336748 RepID=A0A2K9LVF2_SPISQ|nr:hypothetical protein [Spiroplasma monobiae]AUM63019.1 hypothetical protein SMONO_v1c07700 [Spiroplasma monobiae MQ-1]